MGLRPNHRIEIRVLVTPAQAGVRLSQLDSHFRGLPPEGFRPQGGNDVTFESEAENLAQEASKANFKRHKAGRATFLC